MRNIESHGGFFIGCEVDCLDGVFVDDEELPFKANEINKPKEGKSYTVRELIQSGYGVGIRLVEIKNKEYFFTNIRQHQEPIFSLHRFRVKKPKAI